MTHEHDPIALFRSWYEEASMAAVDKPHAMSLSTVGADGRPATRIVLLSTFDERGFVFHTNYDSRKGGEIAHSPQVALLFWWDPLGYQVRIEGPAAKTTPAESDAYFRSRPRGHQLAAWASDQSRVLAGREVLEARMAQLETEYEGRAVPRPPNWGGYRVLPEVMEFWQYRENRLHDRVRYRRESDGRWGSERLAP